MMRRTSSAERRSETEIIFIVSLRIEPVIGCVLYAHHQEHIGEIAC